MAISLICLLLALSFLQPDKDRAKVSMIFIVPIVIGAILSLPVVITYLMSIDEIKRGGLFLGDIGFIYVFHAAIDVFIVGLIVRGKLTSFALWMTALAICFFAVNVMGWLFWLAYYEPNHYNNALVSLYVIAVIILINRDSNRDRLQRLIDKCRSSLGHGRESLSVLFTSNEATK